MYKIINKKKLWATMAADIVGKAFFLPTSVLSPPEPIDHESIKDILVIRTAYIGDVVMTLPILGPLKKRYPGCRITFLTSSAAGDLLEHHPHVDEILRLDAFWFHPAPGRDYARFMRAFRHRRFDLVIEARADIRDILFLVAPARARYKVSYAVGGGAYLLTHVVPYHRLKHKVEYHLDLVRHLGCATNGNEFGVTLTPDERDRTRALLKDLGVTGPFVAAHPGSRLALKKWPPARYARLYDRITDETGRPVVILGSGQEAPEVEEIAARMEKTPVNCAGKLDIRGLAGVLETADLCVCNDSAPMHIAVAMNTPTVALFGPSKSVETAPYGPAHRVVEKDVQCRFACDEGACRHVRHHACLMDVTVDDMLEAVLETATHTALARDKS